MVFANARGSGCEIVVEEAYNIVGCELFPDSAETCDVGEEDGGFSAVGGVAEFSCRRVDYIGDDSGVQELAEGFAEFSLDLS